MAWRSLISTIRQQPFELVTLGSIELRSGDIRLALPPKRAALLAYLVTARPHGLQRREILASLLWSETDDRRARNALSQALHGLRRLLGPGVLLTSGREEVGIAANAIHCDSIEFENDLEERRSAEALERYLGDFLPGLHVRGSIGFERWLDAERSRLKRRAKDAARALADEAEADRNPIAAVRWLQRALRISPTDETDVRRLISLLDGLGDRAGALSAYEELTHHLKTQYDAAPAPETTALVEHIRGRGHAAATVQPSERPGRRDRLAVLPLQNLSGDPEQEYFADGMTDTLITELARSTELPVVSRQSVLGLKGSERPLPEIARRLGVDLLIEGSVLRVGQRVRIAAQLVRAQPEEHLWADSFDGTLDDVLQLQRDVAQAVARRVGRAVPAGAERLRPGSAATVDYRAYDAFLRGLVAFPYITPETFPQTLGHFQRASAIDPDFAEAHAWIAFLWANAAYVGLVPFSKARDEALPAIERAVTMAPELGSVHAIHATALQAFTHDWEAVDAAYRRASELGGGDARSWGAHGLFLGGMGRLDEALPRVEEYIRRDPAGAPFSFLRGWLLFRGRRYEEALEQVRWVASEWPEYPWTALVEGACLLFLGWPARAIETCRAALAAARIPTVLGFLAATLGRAGATDEARAIVAGLKRLAREAYVDPYPLAVAYAGLGEREAALGELERIVREGSVQAYVLPVEVFFDPLRDDPRFEAVRRDLQLPQLDTE